MRAVLLAACLGGAAAGPAGAARTPGNRLQAESQLPLRAVYCTVPLRQQLQAARSEAAGLRPGSPARAAQAARAERIADRLHAVNGYLSPRWQAIDDRYEQAAVRRGQADLAESLREARRCPQRCAPAAPPPAAPPPVAPVPATAGPRRALLPAASAARAACVARCEADAGPASGRIGRCLDPDLLQD